MMTKKDIIVRALLLLLMIYLFLVSIRLMGGAFKLFGKGFAEALIGGTLNPFVGLFVGILATTVVQSSSCTTSIVVGLVASGAMNILNAVPIVIGTNIGTTVTAILASLATASPAAITIALCHLLFNILGICIFYPLRWIPIGLAKELGKRVAKRRRYAFIYVLIIFYLIPIAIALIFLWR